MNGEVTYLIDLPPDYNAGERRYPVVYWLHGLNGKQRNGQSMVRSLNGAIRFGHAPAMIVALVNGLRDKFYCDTPYEKWPLESVIMSELIPHIDATYRTIPERRARAVEGYTDRLTTRTATITC